MHAAVARRVAVGKALGHADVTIAANLEVMHRRAFTLSALCLAACAEPAATGEARGAAAPGSRTPPELGAGLEAAAAAAPGLLGAAVTETSGDRARAMVNGEAACPMHSTVKLIVAAWAAGEVARGRLADDRTVTLRKATSPRGVGRIDKALGAAGTLAVTVGQMLEAMMLDSDNAAMDGLLTLSEGPAAVAQALELPAGVNMARTLFEQYEAAPSTQEAYRAWLADGLDSASPLAFAEVVQRHAIPRALPAADGALHAGRSARPRRPRTGLDVRGSHRHGPWLWRAHDRDQSRRAGDPQGHRPHDRGGGVSAGRKRGHWFARGCVGAGRRGGAGRLAGGVNLVTS